MELASRVQVAATCLVFTFVPIPLYKLISFPFPLVLVHENAGRHPGGITQNNILELGWSPPSFDLEPTDYYLFKIAAKRFHREKLL